MTEFNVLTIGKNNKLTNYISQLSKVGLKPCFDLEMPSDALLLCGGGDVSPCLYGEPKLNSFDIDLERDCLELYLIKKFLNSSKPIFGICRGLQIINVAFGGTLKQDILHKKIHCQSKGIDAKHVNKSINNTFCDKIFAKSFVSSSAHHQAIKSLGKGLKISALCFDGEIEAIESKLLYAVQFHPERMNDGYQIKGDSFFKFMKSIIANSSI